jgi:hypothetical protein
MEILAGQSRDATSAAVPMENVKKTQMLESLFFRAGRRVKVLGCSSPTRNRLM